MDDRYRAQLEGLLSPTQIAALPAAPTRNRRGGMADRLAEIDMNGDGKISKSESPEWMDRFFDRVDENGDGVLDTEEMENMGRGRGRGRDGQGGDGRGGGRGGGVRGGGGRDG
jgi:hypothetical protein